MPDHTHHQIPGHEISGLLPSLTRYAARRATRPDQVPDMVQEAIRRVLSRIRSGAEIDDIERYLFTALSNLCKDQFADRRISNLEVEFDDGIIPDTAPTQLQKYMCHEVIKKIEHLSGPHREILLMVVESDCSYAEISKSLDLPMGTVMSRLARARRALRASMHMKQNESVASLWKDG